MVVYGILTILTSQALTKQYKTQGLRFNPKIVAFTFCMVYGIILELIQEIFLPSRYFDLMDILANIIGCILGLIIVVINQSKKRKILHYE